MPLVKRFPPGMSAPIRRGHPSAPVQPATLDNLPYGQNRSTHPPSFYSETHVFGDRSRALQILGPWRKTAQYAFTGASVPTLALPANHLRTLLIIQNLSAATNLYVGLGAGATEVNGILVLPNGGNLYADFNPPTDDVYIYFAAGAAEVAMIAEGVAQVPET